MDYVAVMLINEAENQLTQMILSHLKMIAKRLIAFNDFEMKLP